MSMTVPGVSPAFQSFLSQAPGHARAWMTMVGGLEEASRLDKKTDELAYLAVLAALGRESGIAFHVAAAREAGASREEVISAVLLGLPAVGQLVIGALPIAIEAYDAG